MDTMKRRISVLATTLLIALVSILLPGSASAAAPGENLADTFPIRHITVTNNREAPQDTTWVTISDGSATSGALHARAIPKDGAPSYDVGEKGPDSDACLMAADQDRACEAVWTYLPDQREVRVAAWWKGELCTIIGNLDPGHTSRITCNGSTVTL